MKGQRTQRQSARMTPLASWTTRRIVSAGAGVGAAYVALRFGVYLLPRPEAGAMVEALGVGAPYFAIGIAIVLFALTIRDSRGGKSLAIARTRRALLIGVFVLAALELIHRILFLGLPPGALLRPFEPKAWQAPSSTHFDGRSISVRQKMLGDVVKYVLPGRMRGEIEGALGTSLPTEPFSSERPSLVYLLGPARGISLDSEWLLIWLDPQGHFVEFKIRED
jgi:hypothetical protein